MRRQTVLPGLVVAALVLIKLIEVGRLNGWTLLLVLVIPAIINGIINAFRKA